MKEQTWLATYERGYPRKFIKEVTPVKRKSSPPLLFRPATLFLKGRLSPAFLNTLRDLSPCNDGQNGNRQDNRLPWVDGDGSDLNFDEKSIIFTARQLLELIFYRPVVNKVIVLL